MSFFYNTYEQSREAFLNQAFAVLRKFPDAVLEKIPVPDDNDKNLFTDILYIPSENKSAGLLMITSGVHGIEAYTGSALQQLFIRNFILHPKEQNALPAFLFIHSINPYGQKYFRRVSTNNVDLNRNFAVSEKLFETKNKAYAGLNDILNPAGPYRKKKAESLRFFLKVIGKLRTNGIKSFRQAILQGQYEFENGIFFGGKRFEPQKDIIQKVTCRFAKPYARIILIDLHTGYGYRGRLHLIGMDNYPDPEILKKLQYLYPTEKIEEANKDGGDFYKITGSMFDFIYSVCSEKDKTVLPVAWEFGTNDNIKSRKSIESLRIMINENRGYHHGYADEKSREITLNAFRNLYYPDDKKWQNEVLKKSEEVFGQLIKQLQNNF